VPTAAHFIYIPFVLLIGITIGFILGGRAARDEAAAKLARDEARAARKAEREKNAPSSKP
jgi:hypothetical protein